MWVILMQDKEEIMRKTKFLKGSSVYVGEDFSKRVRDQRHELQKFMKMMRGRRPAARFSLRYDKLFVDRDVFMFNDLTGQVEQVHHPDRDYGPHVESPADQVESTPSHRASCFIIISLHIFIHHYFRKRCRYCDEHPQFPAPPVTPTHSAVSSGSAASSSRHRSKSSGRRNRLQKSYSTESSLNHMVPNSPVYPQVLQ